VIDNNILQERIEEILALCDRANEVKFGSPEHTSTYRSFWNAVKALDDEAQQGRLSVEPGRFVKWPTKGGYARYIVVKVGSKMCKVCHIPWAEGFRSEAVSEKGEVSPNEIEKILGFYQRLTALFVITEAEERFRSERKLKTIVRIFNNPPVVAIEDF
jgi:hypothetical protein